jgi:hypothetical protein
MERWQSKNASGARVQSRGEGACADLMTGNQGNSFTQQNGKGIPQFAPNFTNWAKEHHSLWLEEEGARNRTDLSQPQPTIVTGE